MKNRKPLSAMTAVFWGLAGVAQSSQAANYDFIVRSFGNPSIEVPRRSRVGMKVPAMKVVQELRDARQSLFDASSGKVTEIPRVLIPHPDSKVPINFREAFDSPRGAPESIIVTPQPREVFVEEENITTLVTPIPSGLFMPLHSTVDVGQVMSILKSQMSIRKALDIKFRFPISHETVSSLEAAQQGRRFARMGDPAAHRFEGGVVRFGDVDFRNAVGENPTPVQLLQHHLDLTLQEKANFIDALRANISRYNKVIDLEDLKLPGADASSFAEVLSASGFDRVRIAARSALEGESSGSRTLTVVLDDLNLNQADFLTEDGAGLIRIQAQNPADPEGVLESLIYFAASSKLSLQQGGTSQVSDLMNSIRVLEPADQRMAVANLIAFLNDIGEAVLFDVIPVVD